MCRPMLKVLGAVILASALAAFVPWAITPADGARTVVNISDFAVSGIALRCDPAAVGPSGTRQPLVGAVFCARPLAPSGGGVGGLFVLNLAEAGGCLAPGGRGDLDLRFGAAGTVTAVDGALPVAPEVMLCTTLGARGAHDVLPPAGVGRGRRSVSVQAPWMWHPRAALEVRRRDDASDDDDDESDGGLAGTPRDPAALVSRLDVTIAVAGGAAPAVRSAEVCTPDGMPRQGVAITVMSPTHIVLTGGDVLPAGVPLAVLIAWEAVPVGAVRVTVSASGDGVDCRWFSTRY